ncbi:signal peptide containing protein [Theileria equi strain WA]|uniref:asparagine--tRNA ligase n=1 Tax=Theileria equi strain WA TaxID=1537102 RepID=L1LEY1_THEEQ|nr:signal peptide containing protein [Theileria equi strain WA]EKX73906.1 signal peptide containing protein [Theileria equi strain WA]|eukprot:XP_004833358.1 signal peptide containing protein [Theileria equi strain WA]
MHGMIKSNRVSVILVILLSVQGLCDQLSIFSSVPLSIVAALSLYTGEALYSSRFHRSIYSFIPGCKEGGSISSIHSGRSPFNKHISYIASNDSSDLQIIQENKQLDLEGRVSIASLLSSFTHNRLQDGLNCQNNTVNQEETQSSGVIKVPCLVKVTGWIQSLRKVKGGEILFIDINDGSSSKDIQAVVNTKIPEFNSVLSLEKGDAISVVGTLDWRRGKPSDKSSSDVDIYVDDVSSGHKTAIYQNGPTDTLNPVMPSVNYYFEHLRHYPHLRSRNKTIAAIFRIRGEMIEFTHKFFKEKEYICTTTPLLTNMDSEGLGELFKVSFVADDEDEAKKSQEIKDDPTYLSVSGQLELESLCCSLGNVWKFGPAFRADRSDTPRHLSEFWMLEAEAIDITLEGIIHFIQEYIQKCSEWILSKCADDVNHLDETHGNGYRNSLVKMVSSNIEILEYTEAVKLLNKMVDEDSTSEHSKISWGENLSAAHERAIIKHFNGIVAIINYPEEIKPFYMKYVCHINTKLVTRSSADGTVQNFDILAPIANELAGGSIREDTYDVLIRKMEKSNISGKEYNRYIQLRQFGNIPHGGFGIGFDRLVMLMTGIQNIRDVIPYPIIRTKDSIL